MLRVMEKCFHLSASACEMLQFVSSYKSEEKGMKVYLSVNWTRLHPPWLSYTLFITSTNF